MKAPVTLHLVMNRKSKTSGWECCDRLLFFEGPDSMRFIFLLLALSSTASMAQDSALYQLRNNGTIDRSKPSFVIQGDKVYARRENGAVDKGGPSFVVVDGAIRTLRRNGTVDYSKPAIKVKAASSTAK